MRKPIAKRLKLLLLAWGAILLAMAPQVYGQESAGDAPLGDVARTFRKKTVPSDAVIDNDNLSKVVDEAESKRVQGETPVFSLDPGGRNFHVSSPDVTCSLSFTGKLTSPLSDSLLVDELPRTELSKLDGPATIDGDTLQVSVHNGTLWELREVLIGLTIVKRPDVTETSLYRGQPRIFPALASGPPQQDSFQKLPDSTVLLRVKGTAGPSTTAVFRTSLNFALFPDQDWHWAIVKAKGIPPQTPPDTALMKTGPAEASAESSLIPATLSEVPASDLHSVNPPPAIVH